VHIVPLIDNRGRLFGRVNLIDAVVGVVVLLLIPLAYAAVVLFGVPVPTVTAVTPAQVTAGQVATVEITGADLRPFLKASFGTVPSGGFFVEGPTRAEVHVPILEPGTYDLVLSDDSRTVLTVPAALTVVSAVAASANVEVQVRGSFLGLTPDQAGALTTGAALDAQATGPPLATVQAVRAPEPMLDRVKVGPDVFLSLPAPAGSVRVSAVVRLRCALSNGECKSRGTVVEQGATLQWTGPAPVGAVTFVVDDVRPADSPATLLPSSPATAVLRVRFAGGPELLSVIKPGDRDIAGGGVVAENDRALLVEVGGNPQPATGVLGIEGVLRRNIQTPQPILTFNGTLRVPVVYSRAGWTYKDRPVKVGAPFPFETVAGGMIGWIVEMQIGPAR
jgi:hypothetical protein